MGPLLAQVLRMAIAIAKHSRFSATLYTKNHPPAAFCASQQLPSESLRPLAPDDLRPNYGRITVANSSYATFGGKSSVVGCYRDPFTTRILNPRAWCPLEGRQ